MSDSPNPPPKSSRPPPAAVAAAPTPHTMQGKVLVVEDEEDVADSLTFALGLKGLTCQAAGNGPEALIKASRFVPDVILLDLNLPGLDGLEVCLRLKSEPSLKNTKVFVVSARSADRDVFLTRQVGADGFIAKPFELKAIVDRVCREISSR